MKNKGVVGLVTMCVGTLSSAFTKGDWLTLICAAVMLFGGALMWIQADEDSRQ